MGAGIEAGGAVSTSGALCGTDTSADTARKDLTVGTTLKCIAFGYDAFFAGTAAEGADVGAADFAGAGAAAARGGISGGADAGPPRDGRLGMTPPGMALGHSCGALTAGGS